MPPANDNWASATTVSGDSGNTTGTNIGATSETGEPSNNGSTVWFKWTASKYLNVFFSTRYGTVGSSPVTSPFRTVLRVFTGSSVSALTEVSYSPGSAKSAFAGWDWGSMVAFNASAGTTYYVRVDSLSSGSSNQGNFNLYWGEYFQWNVGCDGCPPQFDTELQCVSGPAIPDVTADSLVSFGTIAAGKYLVKYVGGAFNVGILATDADGIRIPWTVNLGSVGGLNHSEYTIHYFSGGVATDTSLSPLPTNPNAPGNPGGGNFAAWRNQGEAENAYFENCSSALLEHSGGVISIEFTDTNYGDNVAGTPSPTFCLYKFLPQLKIASACANWTTLGSAATCTFQVYNANSVSWSGVTATLNSSGGISSPSGPLTGLTLGALANNGLTFTFNCSTESVTASITLSCADWTSAVTLTVFLGPILSVGTMSFGADQSFRCGYNYKPWTLPIINSGYWKPSGTVTVSLGGGLQMLGSVFVTGFHGGGTCDPDCSPVFSSSAGMTLGCNGTTNYGYGSGGCSQPYIKSPSSSTTSTVTVTFVETGSGLTLLNVTVPITVTP